MNSYFLVALALMTISAIAFLMLPLWRQSEIRADRSRVPYVAMALLIPSLTIALYVYLGEPQQAVAGLESPRSTMMARATGSGQARQSNVDSVASLVSGLAARLQENPDDAGGWLLLAKSYKHLGNREEAGNAYARAVALGRSDADMEAFLGGEASADAQPGSIHGRVTIDNDMIGDIDGSATVFVVARAASGSPVPLAVLRTTVASLPFDFNLHDGQAMVAGNNLSSVDSVVVTAKVSADGDALNTIPGFEIHSSPVSTTNPDFVSLHIGQ